MTTSTPNLALTLYNSTTDSAEFFSNFRAVIAGVSTSSNFYKIDTAYGTMQTEIDTLNQTRGAIYVPATFVSANYYEANSITEITEYIEDMTIILALDTASDGTVTLNINALGTKSVVKINSSGAAVNIAAGELMEGKNYLFRYSGTQWVWVSSNSADQIYISGTSGNIVTVNTDGTLLGTTAMIVKASGSELDTGTDDAKFATAKAIKDSHNVPSVAPSTSGNIMVSDGTDWTSSDIKADSSEVTTGTSTSVLMTPDSLRGSDYGKRTAYVTVVDPATALAVGDGKRIITIPSEYNGWKLVNAQASVTTPSSSGLPTIQVRNVTDAVDMLTTRITINVGAYSSYAATTPSVIDTSNNTLATGDRIAFDDDVAGTGTYGLDVILTIQKPGA